MDIAVVIPAYNEENFIGDTIASVFKYAGSEVEVIVIDNGSSDLTRKIADQSGAHVYTKPRGNIGALRNYGASQTEAKILVFIDADVTLTACWQTSIKKVLKDIERYEKLITGSNCAPPVSQNWFLKYWFQSFAESINSRHIGTGHMIISRSFFHLLGGFDESLVTGEDYDICQRALKLDGSIENNPSLLVYHHDFPKTPVAFIRREMWHGIGDVTSIKRMLNSKVACASLLFFMLHVVVVFSINLAPQLAMLLILLIISLCFLSAMVKYDNLQPHVYVIISLIFYLYYWGRSASFFVSLRSRILADRN